jgi:soluble lytic murein transglycosylase-like protein
VIRRPIFLAVFAALTLDTAPARAELVFFKTGRSLSIASHRLEGGSLVLTLRSGGEVVCEPSIVARIEADEMPYPERPTAAAAAQTNATPAGDARTMSAAAVRYADLIDTVAAANGVDPALVRAVIQVESAYRPGARSRKGAMGLMQLMPATAQQYGVRNPYDPRSNIEGGSRHLKKLLQRFPKALALAAYNAGESVVERYGGIPPYPETRAYVTRVLALAGN